MKKILISILLPMLYLSSCATDPMKETRDELEIRKAETPEQTVIRQNETIAAIKKQIASKQSKQSIRLNVPDTCEEINEQIDDYFDKMKDVADSSEAFKKVFNVSAENDCEFCRSKEFKPMMEAAVKAKNSLNAVIKQKYLGLSGEDNVNDIEQQYITRLTQLCAQDNTRKKFVDLNNKIGKGTKISQININLQNNRKEGMEEIEKFEDEMNKICAEYDINNLKKARQAVQEKYKVLKSNPLISAVEQDCKYKFWKATNKQCSCYARTYFEEMKKLELKVISEREQCRKYRNDFAGVQLEANIRKRCGL